MRIKCLILILTVLLFGVAMAKKPKKAEFEFGTTKIVKAVTVDSKGGVFKVSDTNTPVDGLSINIPPQSLEKEVTVSIGYNDGKLIPRSGESSDVILVLDSSEKITLKKHLTVTMPYNVSVNPKWIIGYEIDKQGYLHTVDTGEVNRKLGTVSFYTFKLTMITWVYLF